MTRGSFGYAFAGALALSVSLGAQSTAPQNPPAQPAPRPSPTYPAPPAAMPRDQAMVTVEGCLYREIDVPGRNVPEGQRRPVVADEDYVIADTKMIKGERVAVPSAPQSDALVGTSGTAAPPNMYKVKGEDLKLSDHAGRRVQIDGVFTHEKRADNPTAFPFDLVKLQGAAIREVPGDCPKK
jgi:hypothetical protein